MTNVTFPDWKNRKAADCLRQSKEHYSITIVERGEELIYNAGGKEIAIPVSFHPGTTLFLGELAERMPQQVYKEPYWLVLERCVAFLATESMRIDLICQNATECQRIVAHSSKHPVIDPVHWNAKYLDNVILLAHTSLPR